MQVETKVSDYADAGIMKAYRSAKANLNKLGKDLEGQRDRVDELKFHRKAGLEKLDALARRRDDFLRAAAQGDSESEEKLGAFREEHAKQRFEVENLDQMLSFAKEALDEEMRQILSAEATLSMCHRQLSVNIADSARKKVIGECEHIVRTARRSFYCSNDPMVITK